MGRHHRADSEMTHQESRMPAFLRQKRSQPGSVKGYERQKRSSLSGVEEQHEDLQLDMGGCALPAETHEESFPHGFHRFSDEKHVEGFSREEDILDGFSTSHHHSDDHPHHSSVYTPYKHGQRGSHSYQRVLRSDSETSSSFFHPSTFPSSQPHLSSSHSKPRSSRFLKQLKKFVLLRRQERNRSPGRTTSLSSPSNHPAPCKSLFSLSVFFSSRKKSLQEAVSTFCANCSKIWRRWSRDPYSSAHAMSVNIVDLYAAYEDVHATPHSLAGRRDSSSSFSFSTGTREETPHHHEEEVQLHSQTAQLPVRAPVHSDGVHTPHPQLEASDSQERTDRMPSQGLSRRQNRKNAEKEEEEKYRKYESFLGGEKLGCSRGILEGKGVSSSSRRRDEMGRSFIRRCSLCRLRGEQVYLWLALVLIGILVRRTSCLSLFLSFFLTLLVYQSVFILFLIDMYGGSWFVLHFNFGSLLCILPL